MFDNNVGLSFAVEIRRRLIFLLALTLNVIGQTKVMAVSGREVPELSVYGTKRLQAQKQIIEKNISKLKSNLDTTKKNIEIIQIEIQTVNQIHSELFELKKKFKGFLDKGKMELSKNEKALEKIETSSIEIKADQALTREKIPLELIEKEKKERNAWKIDAEEKVGKAERELLSIDNNLVQISGKKSGLEKELKTWMDKKEVDEKKLREMEKKISPIQGWLKQPT